jgi:hypothetical protein
MSKFPDWSGQWRRPTGLAAAWDPTKLPGLGQEAPLTLTPEHQAIFEATLKDRAGGGLTGAIPQRCACRTLQDQAARTSARALAIRCGALGRAYIRSRYALNCRKSSIICCSLAQSIK